MENSENILNEIKEMAPTLSQIKRENPFHSSDEYFEELSANIHQKITEKKKASKTINLLSYLQKPQFAIAASLIVIISISLFYFNQSKTDKSIAQNNTIYWDEILNENNTVVDKIDESLLVEELTNEIALTDNHKKNNINQATEKIIDEASSYVESEYSNDIFNEL
ncbi:MAG: hypothetical protein HXX18_02365 [Bacteroidetes bacterium]|nr:hypothetical protein [Bacteroidota bacterium]